MEDEEDTTDCFFRVKVLRCAKNTKISTFYSEKMNTVEVDGNEAEICLKAECISRSGIIKLSNDVSIGGAGVQADPDTIKIGLSKGIFKTKDECSKSFKTLSNVACNHQDSIS